MSSPSSHVVVAMDGPSGSGKSSASRGVATALGLRYLDTGAMYRAVTHWMLEHGVDVHNPEAVAARAGEPRIESVTDPAAPGIFVDGVDVAESIRSEQVTAAVSAVAAVPAVRARMVALQREAIADGGIVAEGRDIGTTVAPDATVKVFLTADPAVRARRRAAEVAEAAPELVDAVVVARNEKAMAERDARDSSRTASPLTRANDAIEVDASHLTLQEVIDLVVGIVHDATDGTAP